MSMGKVLAACLMMASNQYQIPPAVMVGIYKVEGGRVGQEVSNTNGSYDLGPMQINTVWMNELSDFWGVSEQTAKRWIRDDPCTNMGVAAWILRQHWNETGSLSQAIANYNSRTPHIGGAYKQRVINKMRQYGLIKSKPLPLVKTGGG